MTTKKSKYGPVVMWRGFDASGRCVSECIGTPANTRSAAPRLLEALEGLRKELWAHVKLDVKKHYNLMVADAAAGTAIAEATKS